MPLSPLQIIQVLLACLPPLLLLGSIFLDLAHLKEEGKVMAKLAARLAMSSFFCALILGLLSIWVGPLHMNLAEAGPFKVGLYLDSLSLLMLTLVSFLGAVVTRYSINYMAGDLRQATFSKWLCLTVASVMVLVLSSNLVMFTIAWIASSLSLHQLLTFYKDRPAGRIAARKKFLISRLGDACLIGAIVLSWRCFGTWEFRELFVQAAQMAETEQQPECVLWIASLLVCGALLKSAQFPFHTWLPDTMETPTPVSALMHAGIINAGGYLVLRLSPVIALSPTALNILALVGAFTALFASVIMMTQTSIKRSLAWSTIAQMGFMMLQCGLGAFALAMLHIVAHSLYKAYAFLSSGSIVAITKSRWIPNGRPASHPLVLTASLLTALLLGASAVSILGLNTKDSPGEILLVSIFIMATGHMLWTLWSSSFRRRLAVWGVLLCLLTCVACFVTHAAFKYLLSDVLPEYHPERTTGEYVVMAVVGLLFMGVLVLQSQLPAWSDNRFFGRLYVHAHNGFYVGALASRLTQKIKI